MKRVPKKVVAAAAVFAMSLNMNGCGVYGPAPVEAEPQFSADSNMNQAMYGVPSYLDALETGETSETCETADSAEYDPSINFEACVYGPPEY